jgi:hypothetical protein
MQASQTRLVAKYLQITVSNNNGSFTMYGRKSSEDDWVSLNHEDKQPTSFFKFFRDNSVVPFGSNSDGAFSEINIRNNAVEYYWNNKDGRIDLKYSLVKSEGSRFINTLVIDCTIQNFTEDVVSMDWLFCLDTWFGEKSKTHFYLPGNITVNNETELPFEASLSYIRSYSPEKEMALNLIFSQEDQVLPDRVYFANWKRITESIGLYEIKDGRSFDLKPFSLNDSAIVAEFRKREIYPDREHTYRIVLSMDSDIIINNRTGVEEPTTTTSTTTTTLPFTFTTTTTIFGDSTTEKRNYGDIDLININLSDLIQMLNSLQDMIDKGSVTPAEVQRSREILEEIRRRTGS